jgi:hypothetical protein
MCDGPINFQNLLREQKRARDERKSEESSGPRWKS